MRKGQIINVGKVEDVPPGRGTAIEIPEGNELALYNVNGEFFAIENSCPHKGAPLSEGALCGYYVECAWHGWQFDVRSGECLTVRESIETYPVEIVGGLIQVEI